MNPKNRIFLYKYQSGEKYSILSEINFLHAKEADWTTYEAALEDFRVKKQKMQIFAIFLIEDLQMCNFFRTFAY